MPEDRSSPEFSRVKTLAELAAGRKNLRFEANEAERRALAARFDLASLDEFAVIWSSCAWRRNGVKLSGRVIARYVQSCIVTLDPISVQIDEALEINCLPEESIERLEEDGELIVRFEDKEDPEPILDGRIDLGELASQHLATLIDPYPKSPAAGPRANLNTSAGSDGAQGQNQPETAGDLKPFAALEQLKNRLE